MKKFPQFGRGVLLLLSWFLAQTLASPAFADDVNLKKGPSSGNDAQLANIYSVRQDYFLRFPHAKMAELMRGRVPDTTKEQKGSVYTLPSWGFELEIPPGPLVAKQTDQPHTPDPYIPVRPQYRPLYAYCGTPGAFQPAPQPGMMGNFVPNYSKIAKGQGGAVVVAPKMGPTCYEQPLLQVDNSKKMAQEGDQAIFEYELTTFGVGPISDTQFQMLDRQDNQRFLELFFDPERWLWAARAAGIMQQQQMATNMANTADWETNTAMETVQEYLINVANEKAATRVYGSPSHKTLSQAIYMVQQMYKNFYIYMAILFLLPGAVLTQMKGMVQYGVLRTQSDETQSPFSGLIRATIAIFLIFATQLIVSYMIDVGNSLSAEVSKWVDWDTILGYAHEQEYGPQRDMTINCLNEHLPPPQEESKTNETTRIGGIDIAQGDEHLGKAYSGAEKKAIEEKSPQISKQMQTCYNFFNCSASFGLIVLCIFQVAMMCYLFLLGPLAAAFYAWPNMKGGGGGPGLFNKVFGNWLEAVIVLSLWRFWWNVVLACMTTYISWSKELGWFDPTSTWEMMVFTSFQVLLMVVPFQPFNFQAAEMIKRIQSMSEDNVKGGEGGEARSGGGGGGAKSGSQSGFGEGGGGGGGSSSGSGSESSPSAPSVSDSGSDSGSGRSGSSGSGSGSSGSDSSGSEGGSSSSSASTQMNVSQSSGSSGGSRSQSGSDGPPPSAPPPPPPPSRS